jgi:hypothetical protein
LTLIIDFNICSFWLFLISWQEYVGVLHVFKIDVKNDLDGAAFARENLRIDGMTSGFKLLFWDPYKQAHPKHYSVTNSLKLDAVKRWLSNR